MYHANKNVIAGGNDTLEIELTAFDYNIEWDKIEIRPNGSTSNPLALKKYVNDSYVPNRIKIPLSDFDASIDFTQLILLEFPYSNNAGYFKLGIEKIIFTGGTTPFLWFGEGKTDNIFDGGGIGGQLLARLYPKTTLDIINKVEYYSNSIKIGVSGAPPFAFNWEDVESGYYDIVTIAHTVYGSAIVSPVNNVRVWPRVYRESEPFEALYHTEVDAYPNPMTDIVNIRASNSDAMVIIKDIKGAIIYKETYSSLQNGQADISFLPSGMYFLKLEDDTNPSAKVTKLIKQ